ncbi:O-methyltransferase [Allonocardiopsis opalescens]|uniref:O-methyltransferase n=1 Tax=Allonocardiopsis opalescens TaxID=1144618 RepID=UPI000D054A0C|nr:O-methyltransferase [Allonocardiopsis opalescens]
MADFPSEDAAIASARRRGAEAGAAPVDAASGATLRFLAAAIAAKAVVEIGTGCGVSGLWLLRGMRPDAVLTSVDVEPEHQRLARLAYTEAGFAANRTRLITGRALDVLPRLTDGAYDLVFADAARQQYPEYLSESLRLLRPGGIVVFSSVLADERLTDATRQDAETLAIREVIRRVRDDEELIPLLIAHGEGLLAALKRP